MHTQLGLTSNYLYSIESLLGHNLTEVPIIHTHLEWLGKITSNNLLNQVKISSNSVI